MSSKIILFNKPYGVLSQFTGAPLNETLAAYIPVPDVYAAGRLDKDSEGLLVLTNDGRLQNKLSNPTFKCVKTYWVQVEGEPSEQDLQPLREGIILQDGPTKPAQVRIMSEPHLKPRDPPIRYRKNIPTTWLEIKITEGRNRQVRRMTAAIGYPTLRLVRFGVAKWTLADLEMGKWRSVSG